MRYRLEYHPNPDGLSIYVDKRLTGKKIPLIDSVEALQELEGFEELFEEPEEGEEWKTKHSLTPELIKNLFEIDGIANIEIKRYELFIEKGVVFVWDELVSILKDALLAIFDPDGSLESIGPPFYTNKDGEIVEIPIEELHQYPA